MSFTAVQHVAYLLRCLASEAGRQIGIRDEVVSRSVTVVELDSMVY